MALVAAMLEKIPRSSWRDLDAVTRPLAFRGEVVLLMFVERCARSSGHLWARTLS